LERDGSPPLSNNGSPALDDAPAVLQSKSKPSHCSKAASRPRYLPDSDMQMAWKVLKSALKQYEAQMKHDMRSP
jgi:hypothetical protein